MDRYDPEPKTTAGIADYAALNAPDSFDGRSLGDRQIFFRRFLQQPYLGQGPHSANAICRFDAQSGSLARRARNLAAGSPMTGAGSANDTNHATAEKLANGILVAEVRHIFSRLASWQSRRDIAGGSLFQRY
jgi:hypothetical protein